MKSFAKVNIFLKIVGKRGNYHELISRFMLVKSLYDEVYFENKECSNFELEGSFSCEIQKNTIYKAYKLLLETEPKIEKFFKSHKTVVKKRIPEGSGLGGGSSNCATFLKLIQNEFNISNKKILQIGENIGSDISFFLYNCEVANVSGVGEIVEVVQEDALDLEIITPKEISCSTIDVYKCYRESFYNESKDFYLLEMNSKEILDRFEMEYLNDLFAPALLLYPNLADYKQNGLFFSGSGSSFFKIRG